MSNASPEAIAWIEEMTSANRYLAGRPMGSENWAAVQKLMFTGAILTGPNFYDEGYEGRWCYHSVDIALAALDEWEKRGFEGEPIGWHRHPVSGRRRPEGNPAAEYIEK